MTRPTVDVLSPLLTAPAVPAAAAHQLLADLDLAPRTTVPAWITDPNLRADILAGFAEIPDDLRGAQ
ncbi:hypothetical protein ACFU5Y_04130 [Streptomyces gardneri]|uniref:hypothetical protein n=1 Tax=Streptomyces gardneri TaxID=66892 RepID=UPI0036851C50